MMAWTAMATIAVSFGLALLATPLSRRVAARFGLLDTPGAHKAHARVTPLLGGCAVFAAILAPSLLALSLACYWSSAGLPVWLALPPTLAQHLPGIAHRAPMAMGILGCALALHVLGIIDDRKALGPWIKLTVQLAAAAVVVLAWDVRVLTIAGPTTSTIVSILWIVGITNAFNFLDNMDGLSAGVGAICAAALLLAAASIGQLFVAALLCLLLGALLGFLPYNFSPASTFMGDAGSLVVGFLLAVASCLTTYVQPGQTHLLYGVLAPLVVMAVPLYDMVSVMTIRLREKRNPMVGDRRHFSHRLLRRGMSVRKTVVTIYLCTAATAIAARMLAQADSLGAALLIAQTLMILCVVALLESAESKP